MSDYVTIELAAQLTGYTPKAIRGKIANGVWLENRVYRRAPDGRILISMQGFEAWAEGREHELPIAVVPGVERVFRLQREVRQQ